MRRLLVLMLPALLPLGCNRGSSVVVVTGQSSPPGWEVRYNAAVALARRGSDHVKDPSVRDTLLEMLNEEQQLNNFPLTDEKGEVKKDKEGRKIADLNGAQLASITALQALGELHRRRPEFDLSAFKPSIEKLAASNRLAVSTEAKKLQQTISKAG